MGKAADAVAQGNLLLDDGGKQGDLALEHVQLGVGENLLLRILKGPALRRRHAIKKERAAVDLQNEGVGVGVGPRDAADLAAAAKIPQLGEAHMIDRSVQATADFRMHPAIEYSVGRDFARRPFRRVFRPPDQGPEPLVLEPRAMVDAMPHVEMIHQRQRGGVLRFPRKQRQTGHIESTNIAARIPRKSKASGTDDIAAGFLTAQPFGLVERLAKPA